MNGIWNAGTNLFAQIAFFHITIGNAVMILLALVFCWLALVKKYEPYFLLPFSFGILFVNTAPDAVSSLQEAAGSSGLFAYFAQLNERGILPALIFLGIGAMMDFGPLIANPKSFLLGVAMQLGIYSAFFGAAFLGFDKKAAAAISFIGSADGLLPVFLAGRLGRLELIGPIALAAYSYQALLPEIQPRILRRLTTEQERKVRMETLRAVSKEEKLWFPILVTAVFCLILPSAAGLVGMLMLGNLLRESETFKPFLETASGVLTCLAGIFFGISAGMAATADAFLTLDTVKLAGLGAVALVLASIFGVLLGKLLYRLTEGRVNPCIGCAGASAAPAAVRIAQNAAAEADSKNILLAHAMAANSAGLLSALVTAGTLLAVLGVK